jgi:hypothetical protein
MAASLILKLVAFYWLNQPYLNFEVGFYRVRNPLFSIFVILMRFDLITSRVSFSAINPACDWSSLFIKIDVKVVSYS